MMGAAALPPKKPINCSNSFEYKHKEKRLSGTGKFVSAAHPAGEFSYADMEVAYSESNNADGKSKLNDYNENTWFVSAMSNYAGEKEINPFAIYSEANFLTGVSLPPLFATEWEALGNACAYAHIAKGGVSIRHYFTAQMGEEYKVAMSEYNIKNGTQHDTDLHLETQMKGAAEYFAEKSSDFFSEAETHFPEDTSEHIFVWLQGESDAYYSTEEYLLMLNIMWKKLKSIGFTKFFMIRVDFWGNPYIVNVMRAQELFCEQNENCYMMTRLLSFITVPTENMAEMNKHLLPELDDCRDVFYGYSNCHINEKGFSLVAKKMASNAYRVLKENLPPELEEELVPEMK